jgi:hypothetical protein
MAKTTGYWFGRRPPARRVSVAWGARAILKTSGPILIDLPWDRQSWTRSNRGDRDRLAQWINIKGLPWLRDEIKHARFSVTGHSIIKYDDGLIHLEASPQGSGGYLYIGVWEHKSKKRLRFTARKRGRSLPLKWNRPTSRPK